MGIAKEDARFAMLLAAIATGHTHKPKLKEIVQTGFEVLEELETEDASAAVPQAPPVAPAPAPSPATNPAPESPPAPPVPPPQTPPAKKGKE